MGQPGRAETRVPWYETVKRPGAGLRYVIVGVGGRHQPEVCHGNHYADVIATRRVTAAVTGSTLNRHQLAFGFQPDRLGAVGGASEFDPQSIGTLGDVLMERCRNNGGVRVVDRAGMVVVFHRGGRSPRCRAIMRARPGQSYGVFPGTDCFPSKDKDDYSPALPSAGVGRPVPGSTAQKRFAKNTGTASVVLTPANRRRPETFTAKSGCKETIILQDL